MVVKDLLKIKDISLLNSPGLDNEISNFYACDLLSFVMGHANKENTCLLTILPSANVIAVAVLLDIKAIIFCEGMVPHDDVISIANRENIQLLTSKLDTLCIYREILALC